MSVTLPASRRSGFTLVEIMIVVAIIALLVAIATPGFLRARKRSQAAKVLEDLRLVDAAVSQYAIDNGKSPGDAVGVADWTNYVKKGTAFFETGEDAMGEDIGPQTVDEAPTVPANTYYELQDVVDDAYWDPFAP